MVTNGNTDDAVNALEQSRLSSTQMMDSHGGGFDTWFSITDIDVKQAQASALIAIAQTLEKILEKLNE